MLFLTRRKKIKAKIVQLQSYQEGQNVTGWTAGKKKELQQELRCKEGQQAKRTICRRS
jgi:hypothetical protein